MENLVPLGTGNSRLMKSNIPSNTTLAQLIQMWNNGTFPYDIGPLNSAGISQQGTPLNKDTLLKDATAALFGLGTDAVPDDVLQKISKYDVFEVGDILTTVRTDLDDKWLLCNGDFVSREEYPQLSDIYPAYPNGEWNESSKHFTVYDYDDSDTCGYVAFDGTYYYMFTRTSNSVYSVIRSPDCDTWSSISSYNGSPAWPRILYANGKLAVAWIESNRLYVYSTSLPAPSSMSNWTKKEVYYDSWYLSLQEFKYINGYFVLLAKRADDSTMSLWYSTDLINWSSMIDFGSNGTPLGIAYGNGAYCILYRNEYADKYSPTIKYGTDLSNVSSWEEKELPSDDNNMYSSGRIEYLNKTFVVIYGGVPMTLYFADNPSSSWTAIDTPININRPFYRDIIKMKYFDGVYVFIAEYADSVEDFTIWFTDDISKPISTYSIDNYFHNATYPLDIVKIGNTFRYIYNIYINPDSWLINQWMNVSTIKLPVIAGSGDGAYGYIKAKE